MSKSAKKTITALLATISALFLLNSTPTPAQQNYYGTIDTGYDSEVRIEYPAVDELERTTFGNIYGNQDIYARLERLENNIFGQVSNASLSERVDRLATAISHSGTSQSPYGNNVTLDGSYQSLQNFNNFNSSNSTSFSGNYSLLLFELEHTFLGQTYPADPVEVRVTRLESNIFSDTMDGYPVEDRIQRLSAYADAKDSNMYYDDYGYGYSDPEELKRYNALMNGAKALSLLFMVLQFLL